jgi:hypothetical protein
MTSRALSIMLLSARRVRGQGVRRAPPYALRFPLHREALGEMIDQ